MNLRRKTILIIGLLSTCMFLITLLASNFIVLAEFQRHEEKEMHMDINLAFNSIQDEILDLDILVHDYASWDDTYQFIKDNNTAYIESNLQDEKLKHANINLVAFVNNSGTIIASKTLDIETSNNIEVPDTFKQAIANNTSLWQFTNTSQHQAGLIMLGNELSLLASRPIVTSKDQGGIRGAVIFATPVSAEVIDRINKVHQSLQPMQTIITISIFPLEYNDNSQDASINFPIFEPSCSVEVKRFNETTMAGYAVGKSIFGDPLFVVKIVAARDAYAEGLKVVWMFTEISVIWSVLIGVSTIFLLNHSILGRITKLSNTLTSIGKKRDISIRVNTDSKKKPPNDEITNLTKSINGMLDELETSIKSLNRAQRLASIGELAGQLGHDLRNPLAGIKNGIYLIKKKNDQMSEKERTTIYTSIERSIDDSDRIITSLVDYSGEMTLRLKNSTPKALTQQALSSIDIPSHVKVTNLCADEPNLCVDSDKIKIAFSGIIKNAIDAMAQGGNLKISSDLVDSNVKFSFSDSGHGIPESLFPRLFSPLVTTKAKGMGMSLATCKRIIDAHNGQISVESQIGHGTTFFIMLPTKGI